MIYIWFKLAVQRKIKMFMKFYFCLMSLLQHALAIHMHFHRIYDSTWMVK